MWLPPNKLYATENFSRHNTGVQEYSNFSGQNDIGGVVSLRNIATGFNVRVPAGEPWPAIAWEQAYDFQSLWSVYSGQVTETGTTPIQNLSFGTVGFLGSAGFYHTGDYDTSNGHLIEASFLVTRLTGNVSATQNSYGVYFEYTGEGYDTVSLSDDPPGFVVGKGLSHETFIPATGLSSQLIGFRYGVKGETGHFITTDGTDVLITGRTPGASQMTGLLTGLGYPDVPFLSVVGDLTHSGYVDSDARVEIGNYNWKSPVTDIAGDFIADTAYSTVQLDFITEAFAPMSNISAWHDAHINLVGESGGGEVAVSVLYSNDDWVNTFETAQLHSGSATGMFRFDINSGVSITDPTNHKIKFRISQNSTDGTKASPAVNYITTTYSAADTASLLSLDPKIGAAAGEYPVLLTIDPNDRTHVKLPTGGIFRLNLNHQTSIIELVSGLTGTPGRASVSQTGVFGLKSFNFDNKTGYLNNSNITDLFIPTAGYGGINESKVGFLSSPGYRNLFPTGNYTGASTGSIGSRISPYHIGSKSGTVSWYHTKMQHTDAAGSPYLYPVQVFEGDIGNGFTPDIMSGVSTDSHIYVEALIQVEKGSLIISADDTLYSDAPVYTANRYKEPQRVLSILEGGADTRGIYFVGADETGGYQGTGQCKFTVGDIKFYGSDEMTPTHWTGVSHAPLFNDFDFTSDWAIDGWFRIHGHSEHKGKTGEQSLILIDSSNKSLGIDIDRFGNPRAFYNDDSTPANNLGITGAFGINTTRWNHLESQYRDGYMELYVNGELAGKKAGVVNIANPTGCTISKNIVSTISDIRVRSNSQHPAKIAMFDAFAVQPKFQTEYQFPTGDAMFLYRLDEGSSFDASVNGNDLIFPEQGFNRDNIDYSDGVFGEGVQLHNHSHGHTASKMSFTGDNMFFAGYVAKPDGITNATIASGSNWSIYFSGNHLNFQYGGGIHSSSVEFDTFQYFPFAIDMRVGGGGNLNAVGWYNTGGSETASQMFSGGLTATSAVILNDCMDFGHNPADPDDRGTFFLDEFGLFSGSYDNLTGSWLLWEQSKDAPHETVYIDNIAIDTGRVRHIGIYDKEITMPPMSNFTATGSLVQMSVDVYGTNYKATPMFQYAGARKINLTTGTYEMWSETRDKICKTRSPFRIGQEVPRHAVNLAFLQGPNFSIANNLGLVDNAGEVSSNFVRSLSSYASLSTFTGNSSTGAANSFSYTGEIDTNEVLVTSYVMQRKDAGFAAPLFYRHRLGGDNLFLYQVDASESVISGDDIKMIRQNIKLTDQDGTEISVEDFPWDIRVSKKRDDDVNLPDNVYSVELLTRDRYLVGRSIFVEFNAANPINGYTQVKGWRECVNTEPIYRHTATDIGTSETFVTDSNPIFSDTSSNNFNQGPNLLINSTSDVWKPSVHRNITLDQDFV